MEEETKGEETKSEKIGVIGINGKPLLTQEERHRMVDEAFDRVFGELEARHQRIWDHMEELKIKYKL